MKTALAFLFALIFSFPALAVGIGNDNPPGGGGSVVTNRNDNTNINGNTNVNANLNSNDVRVRSNSVAVQGQLQGQRQSQANVQTVTVAPAVQPAQQPITVNYNQAQQLPATVQEIRQNDYSVKTVPNVLTGSVYPTAPCMGSSQVGAAGLGWGASIGSSWSDHECGKRETARSFQNLGMTADAVAVLCSSEYAAVAPVCKKAAETKPAQLPATAPIVVPAQPKATLF